MPIYHVPEYLGEFIESISCQTIQKDSFEVVFVDDASANDAGDMIESLCEDRFNYRLIRLPDQSGAPGKPRNIGVECSRSRFLVFYDPDHVIPAYALQIKRDLINHFDSQVLSGSYTILSQGSDSTKSLAHVASPLTTQLNHDSRNADNRFASSRLYDPDSPAGVS